MPRTHCHLKTSLNLVNAYEEMRSSERFRSLAQLFKRVKNITKGADDGHQSLSAIRAALKDPAELALAGELEARLTSLAPLLKGARYADAMQLLAELSPVVDKFFADVLVMTDDPTLRQARLALLVQLRRAILGSIGDISELAADDR
jgi:glycyl-tRNA synthetase beta chain